MCNMSIGVSNCFPSIPYLGIMKVGFGNWVGAETGTMNYTYRQGQYELQEPTPGVLKVTTECKGQAVLQISMYCMSSKVLIFTALPTST